MLYSTMTFSLYGSCYFCTSETKSPVCHNQQTTSKALTITFLNLHQGHVGGSADIQLTWDNSKYLFIN